MFGSANLITAANLLGGICSIIFSLSGRLDWAVLVLAISALFDFLDGFVARLTKSNGELGKQLDSLADLVSFGVGEFLRLNVCRKLVTKEVEVNPLVSAPSNITAQEASIKLAGFFDVTNWKSEVERFKVRHNA